MSENPASKPAEEETALSSVDKNEEGIKQEGGGGDNNNIDEDQNDVSCWEWCCCCLECLTLFR